MLQFNATYSSQANDTVQTTAGPVDVTHAKEVTQKHVLRIANPLALTHSQVLVAHHPSLSHLSLNYLLHDLI